MKKRSNVQNMLAILLVNGTHCAHSVISGLERRVIYFTSPSGFQKLYFAEVEAHGGACLQPGALCVGCFKATCWTVITERLTLV